MMAFGKNDDFLISILIMVQLILGKIWSSEIKMIEYEVVKLKMLE